MRTKRPKNRAALLRLIRALERENNEMRCRIYGLTPESVTYTAERPIKCGETIFVRVPQRFVPR